MDQDPQEQRASELITVTNRLNHFADETPGTPIDEVVIRADGKFPHGETDSQSIFHILALSVNSLLDGTAACTVDKSQLSTAFYCSIALMNRAVPNCRPHLILWSKYMYNSIRFNGLALQNKDLSPAEYSRVLSSSKNDAREAGWSELEALRILYEHFFRGGWYYYPESNVYYPEPIGSNDADAYQLVTRHFLLSFPHSFTLNELHALLLGELKELEYEMSQQKPEPFRTAFEAADVFIYLTHIASYFGFRLSDLI